MTRSFLRQLQLRLRDRRFWIIQGLVIAISIAHTTLEATHTLGVPPDLYLLPVSTYFIPVVYAGLNFGLEGAIPTVIWCCFLVIPNVVLFHHGWERLGIAVQLAIIVAVAVLVARRMERETTAKRRVEVAGAKLAELNATASASSGSLDLLDVLHATVAAMLEKGKLDAAWAVFAPERWKAAWAVFAPEGWTGTRQVVSLAGRPPGPHPLSAGWETASRNAIASEHPVGGSDGDGAWAVVPVPTSGRVVGALGMAVTVEPVSSDDLMLLGAIAKQLGVALNNIQNYQEAHRMVAELAQAQGALEQYLQLATDAQEEERKRLARELHDDTIQTLVIVKADLDSIARDNGLQGRGRVRLREAQTALAGAIDDVRRFSRDLRPSLLDDLGLVSALEWLVSDMKARTGIEVRLVVSGQTRRINPNVEVAAYRIVQEALRNVERHSGARNARVRLVFGPSNLTASVIDDGSGFDPKIPGRGGMSLGLLGMRERAKLAGATLEVRSRPGRGTRITLSLPQPPGVREPPQPKPAWAGSRSEANLR
jgi:signal transduction histidine kinase